MEAGSTVLPTTRAIRRGRYPIAWYVRSKLATDWLAQRATRRVSRRTAAASVCSEPKAAWYGCTVAGTVGSLSSIRRRSRTRGAVTEPPTSTVMAQPDFTRQPMAVTGRALDRFPFTLLLLGWRGRTTRASAAGDSFAREPNAGPYRVRW